MELINQFKKLHQVMKQQIGTKFHFVWKKKLFFQPKIVQISL